MARIFRFAYYSSPKHLNEDPALHQLRDGDAAMEIAAVLLERQEYTYGGLLLNYPQRLLIERGIPRQDSQTRLNPDDLILMVGRPPLHDERPSDPNPGRSIIHRSGLKIENQLFAWLQGYFDRSSRAEIRLSTSIDLPPEHEAKRHIVFRQNTGATYKSVGGRKHVSEEPISAAFAIHTREAWPGGPGALCAFGMAGPETLIWSHLLRTRFPDSIARKRFIFAELHERKFESSVHDLRFCEDWQVESIVELV